MTQGQQESREEQQKPVDVMTEILERAGLEHIGEVPLGSEFYWGKAGVWKAEGAVPIPGFSHLFVFALFQNPEEVIAYAVPGKEAPAGTLPHRFTLCKRSPSYFVEHLRARDVFVDEIAKDLVLLAMRGNVAEPDEEARLWAACMASAMTRLSPEAAAKAADAAVEEYNQRQEADEEEEDEPNGAAPTPNPV